MTTNQLRWAELQEGKRHNLVTEGQTDFQMSEQARHNLQVERANFMQAGAAQSQAATAAGTLVQRQYEYDTTGKDYQISQSYLSKQHGNLYGQQFNTESYKTYGAYLDNFITQNKVTMSQMDAATYPVSKAFTDIGRILGGTVRVPY